MDREKNQEVPFAMFVEDKAIIGLMIGRNHPKTKIVCTIGLASESP